MKIDPKSMKKPKTLRYQDLAGLGVLKVGTCFDKIRDPKMMKMWQKLYLFHKIPLNPPLKATPKQPETTQNYPRDPL